MLTLFFAPFIINFYSSHGFDCWRRLRNNDDAVFDLRHRGPAASFTVLASTITVLRRAAGLGAKSQRLLNRIFHFRSVTRPLLTVTLNLVAPA